jgi:RNA polymerase sigma-70 factor (ECF subfamily)
MPDEQDLIAALRRRDMDALAAVFETYSDRIYRLAVSLLHDEQTADGVVQDTFLSLIEHIDTFEGRSKLGTWLYRVAYNHIMGQIRRHKPQFELDDDDNDDLPMPEKLVDWDTLPEALLTSSELQEVIARAVETLSPTLRAVFLLRDIEELSTEETAQALGIQEGAVKVRLHRARLALREQLAGYFEERIP